MISLYHYNNYDIYILIPNINGQFQKFSIILLISVQFNFAIYLYKSVISFGAADVR